MRFIDAEGKAGGHLGVSKLTGASADVGSLGSAGSDVQYAGKGEGTVAVGAPVGQEFHAFHGTQGQGQIEGVVAGLWVVLRHAVHNHQNLIKGASTNGQIRLNVCPSPLAQIQAKGSLQSFGQGGSWETRAQLVAVVAGHRLARELVPQRTHRYFGKK